MMIQDCNPGSSVVFVEDSITRGWEWPDAGKARWEKYFAGAPYRAFQPVFYAVCANRS